jgi:subtilisin family serine protease
MQAQRLVAVTAALLATLAGSHFLGPTGAAAAPGRDAGKLATQHLISFTDSVTETEARALARRAGLVAGLWIPALRTLAVSGAGFDSATLADLTSRSDVTAVEADPPLYGAGIPNDTYYASQWAPSVIGAPAAWDATTGSSGVVVAVLDTGLDLIHPEFAGKTVAGWDFVNADADPTDDNGHGTHVAGIIGGATDNGLGIASIGRGPHVGGGQRRQRGQHELGQHRHLGHAAERGGLCLRGRRAGGGGGG